MKRFKNILVVVDADGGSDALFARAKWLAEANEAKLTLVDVLDTGSDLSSVFSGLSGARAQEVEEEVIAYHRDRLDAHADTLSDSCATVCTQLLNGVGFIEIIRHVLKHDIDLVLKAAHQTPSWTFLPGPDLHLLRKCPCPVWILNSTHEPNSHRILATVDPDPEDEIRDALNHKVMQLATSLARQDNAKLDVLNAWYLAEETALRSTRVKAPEEEITAILEATEAKSAHRLKALTGEYSEFDDLMRVVHVKGAPENIIPEHTESERIDTLIMGTLARTGLSGLLIGNTAETVLNRVGCSVLTVKPEGFVSPVTLDEDEAS